MPIFLVDNERIVHVLADRAAFLTYVSSIEEGPEAEQHARAYDHP